MGAVPRLCVLMNEPESTWEIDREVCINLQMSRLARPRMLRSPHPPTRVRRSWSPDLERLSLSRRPNRGYQTTTPLLELHVLVASNLHGQF